MESSPWVRLGLGLIAVLVILSLVWTSVMTTAP